MLKVLSCAALLLSVPLCFVVNGAAGTTPTKTAAKQKKSSARKKGTSTAKEGSATAKKGAGTAKKGTSTAKKGTSSRGKKGTRRPATTWRNRQTAPSPERYRQIQEALAAKGYLKTEDVDGKWNQNSIDALKKFQREQNIEANGKLSSLSLIALGLGPKYDSRAALAPGAKTTP